MPGSAVEIGAVAEVLPLSRISARALTLAGEMDVTRHAG